MSGLFWRIKEPYHGSRIRIPKALAIAALKRIVYGQWKSFQLLCSGTVETEKGHPLTSIPAFSLEGRQGQPTNDVNKHIYHLAFEPSLLISKTPL